MKGSELLIRILAENGTEICFGYPGGAAMPIYDALYKFRKVIRHVRTAHEQGAAHAADGYARATGKTGVCIATSGPGATNLVSGIATAYADSVPVVFITANVSSDRIGTDAFQEADITGITLPICKYNWFVRDPETLAETVRKAFRVANSGRPGPVVVDVACDVLEHEFGRNYRIPDVSISEAESRQPAEEIPSEEELEQIARVWNGAKRPFVIAGGGVRLSHAEEEVRLLVEKSGAMLGTTLMACGEFDASEPWNCGMLGQYGSEEAKTLLSKADVVLCVGMRFSSRTHDAIDEGKTIIHIDNDRAEVNKNVRAAYYAVGDAGMVLKRLLPYIEEKKRQTAKPVRPMLTGEEAYLSRIFSDVAKVMGRDSFVVTDVGLHQMSVARLYPFRRAGKLITSGGFGTMGFGLGAAIGAELSGGPAVLFTGDGSFRMNLVELATLRENRLKLLVVVLNNGSLGMVRKMQKENFRSRYLATEARYGVPDIRKLAAAYGLDGRRVNSEDDLQKALEDYQRSPRAMVIDLRLGKL